jgi:poly(3-hydroxybutyrate) depolymerase
MEGHRRRIWRDADGNVQVESFLIDGMAHGVPLATTKEESCGSVRAFSWMWESLLRITSRAFGTCTNLRLKVYKS